MLYWCYCYIYLVAFILAAIAIDEKDLSYSCSEADNFSLYSLLFFLLASSSLSLFFAPPPFPLSLRPPCHPLASHQLYHWTINLHLWCILGNQLCGWEEILWHPVRKKQVVEDFITMGATMVIFLLQIGNKQGLNGQKYIIYTVPSYPSNLLWLRF
mgnify:CR=1 FL=1